MTHLTKKLERNEVMELNDIIKTLKKDTPYIIESSNGKVISVDTKDKTLLKFAKDKGLTWWNTQQTGTETNVMVMQ